MKNASEPSVGMFWFIEDINDFIGDEDTKSLSSFQHLDKRTSVTNRATHSQRWTFYNEKYVHKPEIQNYMFYPRGRVTYLGREKKFEIRIDQCIYRNKKLRKELIKIYCLENQIVEFIPNPNDEGALKYICKDCGKIKPIISSERIFEELDNIL